MFTQPCFIRKNTEYLRLELEKLGYQWWSCYDDESVLVACSVNFKMQSSTHEDYVEPIYISYDPTDCSYLTEHGYIDCGTNEKLFLSIAALNDETDKHQYFIADDNPTYIEKSNDDLPSKYMQMEGHKMTVEELINFYNK